MIIMGIDPGTIKAGYGVIDARGSEIRPVTFGVARAKRGARENYGLRLKTIFEGLREIAAVHVPQVIILETAFSSKSIQTAIKIGEGRAMAILVAALAGIELVELPPAIIKKGVTGRGDATKDQVGEMVRLILGLDTIPEPDDAADALACAIAGYHRVRNKDAYLRER